MKKYFLPLSLIFLFISCQFKEDVQDFQTITIKEQYSVELPSYMSATTDLNDDASLQYQNAFKELYAVVLDEQKTDLDLVLQEGNSLESYAGLLKTNFTNGLQNTVLSKSQAKRINGLKAQCFTIEGTLEGHDIYYDVAVLESQKHYYQFFTWTLKSQKEKYAETMQKIIASFKEGHNKTSKKRLPN